MADVAPVEELAANGQSTTGVKVYKWTADSGDVCLPLQDVGHYADCQMDVSLTPTTGVISASGVDLQGTLESATSGQTFKIVHKVDGTTAITGITTSQVVQVLESCMQYRPVVQGANGVDIIIRLKLSTTARR